MGSKWLSPPHRPVTPLVAEWTLVLGWAMGGIMSFVFLTY